MNEPYFKDGDNELSLNNILSGLNINDNYIDNLKEKEIKEIHNEHILKCLNRVWQLKINNNKEKDYRQYKNYYNNS